MPCKIPSSITWYRTQSPKKQKLWTPFSINFPSSESNTATNFKEHLQKSLMCLQAHVSTPEAQDRHCFWMMLCLQHKTSQRWSHIDTMKISLFMASWYDGCCNILQITPFDPLEQIFTIILHSDTRSKALHFHLEAFYTHTSCLCRISSLGMNPKLKMCKHSSFS